MLAAKVVGKEARLAASMPQSVVRLELRAWCSDVFSEVLASLVRWQEVGSRGLAIKVFEKPQLPVRTADTLPDPDDATLSNKSAPEFSGPLIT